MNEHNVKAAAPAADNPGSLAAHHSGPIGITMGDAAGIGPEIIAKLFAGTLPYPAVVYGDAGILRATLHRLGMHNRLQVQEHTPAHGMAQGNCGDIIPVLNRWQPLPENLPPGQINAQAGRGAYEYLCHAIDDALSGRLRAIVTAPLHKKALQAGGIDQPGHTEILAQRSNTPQVAMMLANKELRVILVTIHVPLNAVSALITPELELATIELAHRACLQAGIRQPRVAVAGLNPHAGEDGKFGHEEAQSIAPAIAQAQAQGINATGPWPGDTIFMRARKGEFDIVVAQYHDQGLIPVKYLGVDEGVNVTVGLPFIRTSVDHGTAFDIAGRGMANPGSLRAAFELALSLT
jgi:4-hydroxythreonine-4-phosphate dehydrogenase